MRQYKQPLLLSFLMIILSLSVATNSLNESTENTVLEAIEEPKEVILSLGSLNVPGHQEGSIYTNTTISAGGQHTCAIAGPSAIGTHLYCWGRGNRGQLGTSATQENVPTSTLIPGGDDTVAISSGDEHTCAILDDGDVRCWGRGDRGQLGNGGTSSINSPTLTSSLGTGRTAVAISSGESHTCAILDNGSVSCWGRGNYGQLGDGDILDRNTPTLTSSLGTGRTAIALSSGDHHTCAILDNGSTSCWGRGDNGRLGYGGTSQRNSPTLTSSLGTGRTAVAISSGGSHTCAILDNGEVSCWGYGANGELGNGATGAAGSSNTPMLTNSLGTGRTAVAISLGGSHT
ncbi:MAG: hypothetical protein HON16_05370, partial [Euryarchaeota archaeon]|nr:hypothetical protein [Euryarchaeota archaeon]